MKIWFSKSQNQNQNILLNKNWEKKNLIELKSNYNKINLNSYKNKKNSENFYIKNIFEHLTSSKVININCNYCSGFDIIQKEININMRKILIEWIINITLKFKLDFKILFLTINLIDNYIQNKSIVKKKFQLLGITCLYIACKYELIYPPNIKYFVTLCDGAYSKENVINMESKILKIINFDLNLNQICELLINYKFHFNLTDKQYNLCWMIYLLNIYKAKYINIKPNNYSLSLLIASSKLIKNLELMNKWIEKKDNKMLGLRFINELNNYDFNENCIITKMFTSNEYFKVGSLNNKKLIFN